jgi:1,4-alpha-glucan branching enzyme
MKSRCLNPNDKSYKNYGGRGIKVCESWQKSFTSFIDDMGWRPNNKYSIERIDYNEDYCPDNCKWILKSEQTKNCRRVKLIAYNGKEHCLTDLCKLLNLPYSTMRHRVYDLGIPFEEAAKYPQHYKFKKYE